MNDLRSSDGIRIDLIRRNNAASLKINPTAADSPVFNFICFVTIELADRTFFAPALKTPASRNKPKPISR